MDLTFDEVFKVPLKAMKISGAHPDLPIGFKWFLQFLIIYGVYAMYLIALLYNVFCINLRVNDITEASNHGIVCVVIISITFQYGVLLWKRNGIKILFEKVKIDYIKAKKLSYEHQEIVLKYAKQSIWVGKIWLTVVVCGVITSIAKNVLLHIYYCYIGGCQLVHIHDFVYPKIINDRKEHAVIFSIVNLQFISYSAYTGVIYCSFSPLGPNLMLHACGQLEILITRTEKLFTEKFSVQDITNELKRIAMELQIIYNFVDELKSCVRIAYEVVLRVTSILLPVTVYEVIKAFTGGHLSVENIVFIFGSVIIAGSPCYYSEVLIEKGEMFRMALYCCGWERTYDRRTHTMILLLLQRASRPIAISTVFRTLCLDTLTDFCRQSYAIFGMMNALWD